MKETIADTLSWTPKLSLIVPCFNEAPNLPGLADRCQELANKPNLELILVDNGSTDETSAVMKRLFGTQANFRTIRVEENQGYGHGILTGLRAATGDVLGWSHADLQTDPRDALRGLNLFRTYGPNIFVKGKRHGRPPGDVFFTAGMSLFESLLLRHPMFDINAQPTMFSRDFFLSWRAPPDDFALDLYAYYLARRRALPVHRFPVYFGKRGHGVSRWNVDWNGKRRFIRRTIGFSLHLRKAIDE
jgi:glycosyltransferase involved in cell wall biosynthesis